jgi:hypothetical protein
MKNKFVYAALILSAASIMMVKAQNPHGYVVNRWDLYTPDMYNLSHYNMSYGTARSAAMGGAFTSLGADMSSMLINPAGLGMYMSSDINFSPAIGITETKNGQRGGNATYGSKSHTKFSVNNYGFVINPYQSSGALTSFSFGFAYNKLADFNYRSTVNVRDRNTIANIFANQLMGTSNIGNDGKYANFDFLNLPLSKWGAGLAWNNQLLLDDGTGYGYVYPGIGEGSEIDHYLETISKGYIGEYTMAGGFNFNNVFYLGLAVSFQDIYQNQWISYSEDITENTSTEGIDAIRSFTYNQGVRMFGTGVNFKLGMIARPVAGLRIGVAIHSPTIVSVDHEYRANMTVRFDDGDNMWETYPDVYTYDFITPTRLMAGLSYTFGDFAILSADYERAWYNGMRLKDNDLTTNEEYKEMIKNGFQGSHILRAGLEIKPTKNLAIRAGYSMQTSSMRDTDNMFDTPIAYETRNISAGIGYRFNSGAYVDLTYVNAHSTYSDYDMFYQKTDAGEYMTGNLTHARDRHNVMLTIGFRF